MSVSPVERRSPAEGVAGFLATLAIFAAVVGIAYRPVRLIPVAIVLALVSVGIGGRHERLAAAAVAVTAVSFVVGMVFASWTGRPLW